MAGKKQDVKDEPEDRAEDEDAEGQEKPGLSKKKKLIIIGAGALVVVIISAVAGLFLTGILGAHKNGTEDKNHAPSLPQAVYYEFQPMTVNLNTGGRQTKYLKLKFTLELPSESDKSALQSRLPKITDTINTYLRELRSSDLVGSAGVYRLKEELQLRINKIIYPAKVNEVLIEELQDQ